MKIRVGYLSNPDIAEYDFIYLDRKIVDDSEYYDITTIDIDIIKTEWCKKYGMQNGDFILWTMFHLFNDGIKLPWYVISVLDKDHTIITIKTKNTFLFNNIITGERNLYVIEGNKVFEI